MKGWARDSLIEHLPSPIGGTIRWDHLAGVFAFEQFKVVVCHIASLPSQLKIGSGPSGFGLNFPHFLHSTHLSDWTAHECLHDLLLSTLMLLLDRLWVGGLRAELTLRLNNPYS